MASLLFLIHLMFVTTGSTNNTLSELATKGSVRAIVEHSYIMSAGNEYLFRIESQYFDERGNEVLRYSYRHDTLADSITYNYKYNGAGNKIEEYLYGNDGKLSWKTTYSYNADGTVSEIDRYHGNGVLEDNTKNSYDDKGRKIKAVSVHPTGEGYTTTYKYDVNGRLIKKGVGESVITNWQYDLKGNILGMEAYDGFDNSQTNYIYLSMLYDKVGNWTKEVYVRQDLHEVDTFVTRRSIIYNLPVH